MSAFTALNGGSSQITEALTVPAEAAPSSEDGPVDSAAPAARHSPDASSSQKDRPAEEAERLAGFHSANYPDVDGAHKRKRSNSPTIEVRLDPPPSQERPRNASTAQTHADAYGTPTRERRNAHDDGRDADLWRARHGRDERRPYDDQQNSAASTHSQADEQMGDALSRAANQANDSDWTNASPEAEESSLTYGSAYGAERQQDVMLQHDPKKRKRNFSNRTKTGCLTCRKRKKKCDEQKPECSNCLRGRFLCAGYPPQRGTGWKQPENKGPVVPLESKDPSYVPPGAYGMPQQNTFGTQLVKRESLPPYRGQALRIDPPQGRPLATDDDRPTASTLPSASATSPPDMKLSAMSHTPGGSVFPTPVSANTQLTPFGERMSKEYQRVPSLHDLTRAEPETPHLGNPLPQIKVLHPTRANSLSPHGQPSTSNTRVTAQLALSHPQFPQRRTQKEEMRSGRQYFPLDKELCLERERCAAACWRFNNLTAPHNGVSPGERQRLFLDILQPREPVRLSPTEASAITNVGRVGNYVTVEAPFTCDYGYNVSIGHSVVIGRNCIINDVCEVKIGDHCVLGPNVSIYTGALPIDPKKRQGAQGPQHGRGIVIEQDCWIGGGATILPGRTIGKGSTVGAGSIVTKDVPPFTIVAGNPARVLRGIAS